MFGKQLRMRDCFRDRSVTGLPESRRWRILLLSEDASCCMETFGRTIQSWSYRLPLGPKKVTAGLTVSGLLLPVTWTGLSAD